MKGIKTYENDYFVGKTGKVFSRISNKFLKAGLTSAGYETVVLYKNGKGKTHYVHKLVADAFLADEEGLPCINHKDGDKRNNWIDNLERCDYSHNTAHAYAMGLAKRGSSKKGSKLKERDITMIFNLKNRGYSQNKIAEMYSVSRGSIQDVLDGTSWLHTGDYYADGVKK